MDSRFVVFAFVALFSVLQGSEALRCYQCSSRGITHGSTPNSQCADPIDPRMFPQDCTTNAVRELNKMLTDLSPQTSKIIDDVLGVQYQAAHFENAVQCQKLDILIDNRYNYTIRSCVNVAETPDEHCRRIMALNNDNVRTTYCGTCTADGCNGATGLVGSLLLSVALPAALLAILRA